MEVSMKKTVRKIAMILILIILTNSLSSCFTMAAAGGGFPDISDGQALLGLIVLEALIFPVDLAVAGVVLIVKGIQTAAKDARGKKMEDIDTFSANINSLPPAQLDSLTQKINSLPEAELAYFMEIVNSFSESEFDAIVAALNNLSEEEIASSIEALNSMPEETLIASLYNFQQIEFRYQD
jgi:predicted small secreted protein